MLSSCVTAAAWIDVWPLLLSVNAPCALIDCCTAVSVSPSCDSTDCATVSVVPTVVAVLL